MLEGIKITIKANNSSDIDLVNNKSIRQWNIVIVKHAYDEFMLTIKSDSKLQVLKAIVMISTR